MMYNGNSTMEYRTRSRLHYLVNILLLFSLVTAASWLFMKVGIYVADIGFTGIMPHAKPFWPHGYSDLTLSQFLFNVIFKGGVSILILLIGLFVGISGYIFAMAVPVSVLIAVLGLIYNTIRS